MNSKILNPTLDGMIPPGFARAFEEPHTFTKELKIFRVVDRDRALSEIEKVIGYGIEFKNNGNPQSLLETHNFMVMTKGTIELVSLPGLEKVQAIATGTGSMSIGKTQQGDHSTINVGGNHFHLHGMSSGEAREVIRQLQGELELSNHSDEQFFRIFRELYCNTEFPYIRRLDGEEVFMDEGYVPLDFINRSESQGRKKRRKREPFPDVELALETTTLANLFDNSTSKDPFHHLLIEGTAGSGKSTFLRYLAFIHAYHSKSEDNKKKHLGEWSLKYDLLLYVPLDRLAGQKNPSLGQLMIDENPDLFEGCSAKEVEAFLAKKRVLYLLDGYDSVSGREKAEEWVKNALRKSSDWILASKPGSVANSTLTRKPCKRLSILGFGDESVDTYIDQFITDDTVYKSLSKELDKNAYLRSCASNPFFLGMLCQFWGSLQSGNNPTPAYLTIRFFLSILSKHFSVKKRVTFVTIKQVLDHSDASAALHFYAQVAWKGAVEGRSIFNDLFLADFHTAEGRLCDNESIQVQELLKTVGLLAPARGKTQYEFIHPSFQLLFCALQLIVSLRKKAAPPCFKSLEEFFDQHRSSETFPLIFVFAVGILAYENDTKTLEDFYDYLLPKAIQIPVAAAAVSARCLSEMETLRPNPRYAQIQAQVVGAISPFLTSNALKSVDTTQTLRSRLSGAHGLYKTLAAELNEEAVRPDLVQFLATEGIIPPLVHAELTPLLPTNDVNFVVAVSQLHHPMNTWRHQTGDYALESAAFESSARIGNAAANYYLGCFSYYGFNGTKDMQRAEALAQAAANGGYHPAKATLASIRLKRLGNPAQGRIRQLRAFYETVNSRQTLARVGTNLANTLQGRTVRIEDIHWNQVAPLARRGVNVSNILQGIGGIPHLDRRTTSFPGDLKRFKNPFD